MLGLINNIEIAIFAMEVTPGQAGRAVRDLFPEFLANAIGEIMEKKPLHLLILEDSPDDAEFGSRIFCLTNK